MGLFSFLTKKETKNRLAVIDVTDSDFHQQVIQKSYKKPIIVDYWAAWCGPCQHLGPILERIAEEPDSNLILAKLDTEVNRKTAGKYHIHSIPHVKAFRNGHIINEFTGALPEALVRIFIKKVVDSPVPSPRIKGSPNPEHRLKQAEHHLMRGRGFEAFVLLEGFPQSPQKDRADSLIPLARFIFDMDDGDGLTGLDELDEAYLAAAGALHKRNPASALDHLSSALILGEDIDASYTNGVINSLLELLGNENPISQKYRTTRARTG